MKRFWNRIGIGADADEPGDASRYQVRETRPHTQLAVRVALWGAIVVGAVGGSAGLLGLTGGTVQQVQAVGHDEPDDLPAPVTGAAERAVEAWLTTDDEEVLAALFVEPPAPPASEAHLGWVEVTAVAGGRWQDGYWLVTLAVDVYECVVPEEDEIDGDVGDPADDGSAEAVPIDCRAPVDPDDGDTHDADAGDEVPRPDPVPRSATWYVEVGVVGDLDHRVAVLATPAIVPPPAAVSDGWRSAGREASSFDADEPIAATVQEFLRGWVAGGADSGRYLAPGVEARPLDPAPFTDLVVTSVAYDELEPGRVRTWAEASATTPGGVAVTVAYEVEVTYRDDRWEIAAYWGAPTLAGRPR